MAWGYVRSPWHGGCSDKGAVEMRIVIASLLALLALAGCDKVDDRFCKTSADVEGYAMDATDTFRAFKAKDGTATLDDVEVATINAQDCAEQYRNGK